MSALSAAGGGASAPGGTAPKLTTKSKFHKLDINNLYCHSRGESSEPSSVKSQLNRKHGMQSLGKVPSARRPPANLPSLKTESGLDPTTSVSSSSPQSAAAPASVSGATVAPSVTTSSPASVPTTSVAAAPLPTPSITSTTSTSVQPPSQQCPPQTNNQSHQHAGPYQGGWAALPHHRSAQFQQEFPSLDGAGQAHAPGPSLRPQTEGSWMSGGSRGGAADGPTPGGDIRSAPNHLHRALIPNFMYKGNAGSGGNNQFPPVFGNQAPSPGPAGRHPPPNRGPPQRTRELSTMDKLVQTPIIKEEELNSMDEIAQDTGWAMSDEIDYSQKLSFSDDESPKEETAPVRATRGSSKDNIETKAQSPAPVPSPSMGRQEAQDKRQNVIKGLDEDELWAMRRQHSSELAAVAERAKQRKQQEERRYEEERRARQQESQGQKSENVSASGDPEQSATSGASNDKEKSAEPEISRDQNRQPGQGGKLHKSSSRDSIKNGPEGSDFRQMTQIDSRGFRDQGKDREKDRDRDRDRNRDRDYRDKDFYRERENRDRESERDNRNNRDRDHPRTERERDREVRGERDGPFKFFYGNMPPRFMKQGRNQNQQQNQDRPFSENDNQSFNNRSSNERQDSKEKNRGDQEKSVPFAQQYDTRFAFPNVKSIQGQGSRNDQKRGDSEGGKGLRRTRTDSDIGSKDGDKADDRRRERHTPDEPRHPRHAPRKLSGSSDGRGRDYGDNDYQRWEKDHDRRSGSSFDDKKNVEYNDHGPQRDSNREGSYDWRSEKDYDNKGRNYREVDRQNSRESQKDFSDGSRKSDFERKSSIGYDKSNAGEKSEDFNRKSSTQDFDSRKSDTYDGKSSEKYENESSRKQPDRPESRDSREWFKDAATDKSAWADPSQEENSNYPKPGRNDSIKNDNYVSREHKRDKSDSDDSRRGGVQIKKSPSNLQKSDISSFKENKKNEDDTAVIPTKGNESPVVQKPDPPKAWSEVTNPLLSSGNNKNQDDKDTEKSDSGKERLERKLSSSGSEKKSSIGSRNRLDSGGSRRGMVYYNRGNWSGRGTDSRRRGQTRPSHARSNRESMYSESEISDSENIQPGEGKPKSNRSPKSKKIEKDEKNKNMGVGNNSNGSLQNVFGDNRGFTTDTLNSKKRHDSRGEGREAFAPRGEPSRRGRGSFRGRSGYGSGSSKHPFSQSTQIEETLSNDLSKGEPVNVDDKNKSKHPAGVIGKERRGTSPRMHDKSKPRKAGGPASGEEEAWETTSEHSDNGAGHNKRKSQPPRQGLKVGERKNSQGRGSSHSQNRQNSSTNITRNKKDDLNSLSNTMSDMKIGPKGVKDVKKDKDSSEEGHPVDDGFQEVRNKKIVKDVRGPPIKEDIPSGAKPTKPHHKEGQRNNSSSRNPTDKPGNNMGRTTGPPGSSFKVNGPQPISGHLDRGPPSKLSQYERQIRQNNLPPRLIRQMENNFMQKQQQNRQGFNVGQPNDPNMQSMQSVSAWDKPINPTLRTGLETDQSLVIGNVTVSGPESNELGPIENHSGHSSQRSTPNISAAIDQKAPGPMVNMEKSGMLDGTTTPVKTIIFENTNYKSGPEGHKQKFAPVGNQQNVNSASNKPQQCAPQKTLISQSSSDLDTQILNFTTESQQSAPFISDLISGESGQPGKQDAALQLPLSFKNAEDSADMKLDFFDSELSQLTEDKSNKSLGISRMHTMASSQNTISTATDQELNMKIASVKKVWDNNVMEHPTSEENSHSQHNLSNQHMSVSSPHSLSSQHSIGAHHMASQHNLTSQHNLSQQLGSPHTISQHNLGVSQHALSSQHSIAVSSAAQFTSGFDDHQTSNDVGQSQGFSPSNTNVTNQAMNVCKVKSAQQALHSAQGMSGLQNMQATLIGQNMSQTTAALQSMQGVGGVMGLSPPPMQHTAYNHINYPGNQYGGISAIPSPPTVLFNSSQPLLSSSQQMASQTGLYNTFQIDQSRNQYGGFPSGPYGAGSAPYNYQPDMFQGIQNQYRMQDLFQPSNAFGQSGQLGTNPNTMLISSSTNSLMSASVKPSSQQIGPIGTKGASYQTQQYLGYGAPHEAQAPPPYPTTIPPPSLVRAAPQAAPPPLQAPNTYYSQNTVAGGQTGFYQQTGNVSANYGLQFNQPNQNHSNAGIQGFGSQVLSSQFQMAAAMQQQYNRAAHQGPYVGSGNTGAPGGKDHQVPHPSTPQQLKSPLQDHLNNGMFGNSNQGGGNFGAPGGSASPKGNPASNSNNNKNVQGQMSGFNSGNIQGNKSLSGSQHSPPQHNKYQQPYPHMQQVMQANGRQASLNMAMNRGNIQQPRYPGPIQRPHAPPPSHQQQQSNYNRGGNNRHMSGGNQSHTRHPGPGAYTNYQQNISRTATSQSVTPTSAPEPPKPISIAEEPSPSSTPVTTAAATSEPLTTVTPATSTTPAATDASAEKKAAEN